MGQAANTIHHAALQWRFPDGISSGRQHGIVRRRHHLAAAGDNQADGTAAEPQLDGRYSIGWGSRYFTKTETEKLQLKKKRRLRSSRKNTEREGQMEG